MIKPSCQSGTTHWASHLFLSVSYMTLSKTSRGADWVLCPQQEAGTENLDISGQQVSHVSNSLKSCVQIIDCCPSDSLEMDRWNLGTSLLDSVLCTVYFPFLPFSEIITNVSLRAISRYFFLFISILRSGNLLRMIVTLEGCLGKPMFGRLMAEVG